MSAFKQALAICGLTQSEAADFLNVRLDTVKSWSSGRNPVPDGVWQQLGEIYDRMDESADNAVELIREKQPDEIEFSYSGEHGRWPSVGTAFAVEAMIRLRLAIQQL